MQQWLRCQEVTSGMFSDELAVAVQRSDGEALSYFVPRESVEIKRQLVRVDVYTQGAVTWAMLPSAQPEIISVNQSDLSEHLRA